MSFSSSFLANFTDEEKESEIVKIYALQGDNADMALAQEANKRMLQSTELIAFPESRLRSWLSFLLRNIPNITSASGTVHVTVEDTTGNDVVLKKGSLLSSASGVLYTQTSEDVQVQPGHSVDITITQGEASENTGTYSEYISIPAADIDLANIQVFIESEEIPRCKIVNDKIIPINGFHAFFFNSTLYVKIYPGEDTPYPEGKTYSVITWQSEGRYGNIPANSVVGYVDPVLDIDGIEAQLSFENPPILNGANAPTKADLVNKLRYWFFVKDSVSSIPEYRIWYLNQIEVGAVIVEGDYERYLRSPTGQIEITGRVYVAALDRDGKPLVPAAQRNLDERIQSVKDIAIVQWEEPVEVKCFIDVRYQAATNVTEFVNILKTVINNYFNISWLRDQDKSLFDDLDFEQVRESIGTGYSQVGLEIVPYHVYVDDDVTGSNWTNPTTSLYKGENLEGYYKVYAPVSDENAFATEPYAVFKQFPLPDGTTDIYCVQDSTGQFTELPVQIGKRQAGVTEISGYQFQDHSKIEAYWGIEEPGILPVGATYGYRSLHGMTITQYSGD